MVQASSSNSTERVAFSASLRALNARRPGESPSLLAKIFRAISSFFKTVRPSGQEKWEVHVSAEHTAQEEFSGNNFVTALKTVIQYLEKAGREDLAYSVSNGILISYGERAGVMEHGFREQSVKALSVGQSLVMPARTLMHDIMLEIACTGVDTVGKKIYTVTVYNTGDGLRYHPKGEKDRYQIAYILENVQEERLYGGKTNLLTELNRVEDKEAGCLYEEVLPALGGTLVEKPEDRRLWSHGQFGGSCSASCVLAFLRSRMTDEEFKEFRDTVRQETFLKTYSSIIEGKATSRVANIALEIARKLQSRISKQLSTIDPTNPRYSELVAARQGLTEARQNIERARTRTDLSFVHIERRTDQLMGHLTSKSLGFLLTIPEIISKRGRAERQGSSRFISSLIKIFDGMKREEIYSTARHQELSSKLAEVRREMRTRKDLSAGEKIQLTQFALELTYFLWSEPLLTKDQIYLCAGVLSLIMTTAKSSHLSLPPEFLEIAEDLLISRYTRMSKRPETVQEGIEITALINEGVELVKQACALMPDEAAEQESEPLKEAHPAWRWIKRKIFRIVEKTIAPSLPVSPEVVDWKKASEALKNSHKYQPIAFNFENKTCSVWEDGQGGISIRIPGQPPLSLSADHLHLYIDHKRHGINEVGIEARRKVFFDALRQAIGDKNT